MDDLMPFLPGLLGALAIFSLGFLVIGPNLAAIIATSLAQGRARGLAMAAGIALGSGLWATLTVVGLSSLMASYAGAMTILRYAGAAFLLWLAFKSLRSALADCAESKVAKPVVGNGVLSGFLIQMTNPKAALQWMAISAVAMVPGAPWQVGALLVICGTLLSLAGHGAYALAFSTALMGRAYGRFRRWIEGAIGVVLATFAFRLATDRG